MTTKRFDHVLTTTVLLLAAVSMTISDPILAQEEQLPFEPCYFSSSAPEILPGSCQHWQLPLIGECLPTGWALILIDPTHRGAVCDPGHSRFVVWMESLDEISSRGGPYTATAYKDPSSPPVTDVLRIDPRIGGGSIAYAVFPEGVLDVVPYRIEFSFPNASKVAGTEVRLFNAEMIEVCE